MATYVLTIGGSAKVVNLDGFSLQDVTNGVAVLNFDIRDRTGTYRPAINQDVILTEDGNKIFGGLIEEREESGIGQFSGTPGIVTRVTAKSYSLYATRRLVTAHLAAGTLKSQLIALAEVGGLDYLETAYGVTVHGSQADGPAMPEQTVTNRRLDDLFNDLAATTGAFGEPFTWKIDPDKQLIFAQSSAGPFDVIEGPGCKAQGDIRVQETRNDLYANRLIGDVTGAGPAEVTETFVASGARPETFVFKYPAVNDITLTWQNRLVINGVEFGPVAWDPGGAFGSVGWIYDPINGTFTDDGSATDFALLGDLVTVRHAIGYPYSITVEDAAAIALYGLWERRVTRADAMSTEAMTALLTGLLAQQKPTRKTINYETFETGVLPGHVHTVTTAKRDFDGDVLVQEVTTTWASNSKTRRSVSAVESLVFQGTSRDTLDQWMRGGTGGTSATVSPAGLVMGPGGPRYAVQSRGPHDELYGDDYLLHDDDLGGAAYGPNVKTSRLAIKVPNDDQSILALLNASLSADKALTITQYDDGTTDIDLESGAALSINTYGVGVGGLKPRINLTSAESIVLEPNSKFVDYVRHRGLSVHDGFALADDSFTTTYTQDGVGSEPYTLLRYRGSTSVSINLIAIAAAAARIASLYCRVIAIVHDGSAGTLTIDPNSTETIGNGTAAASTFALTSGQSVLLALVSGTGGGVKILASHGMSGSGTPGGADTQVQYNDGGAFGGDANFVWNKTRQQLQVKADTNDDDSPVRVVNESTDQTVIALHPFNSDEARILLGREYAGAADIARHARPVAIVKDATDFYVEMGVGETPGSAMAFAKAVGLGFSTSGSSGGYIYAYGFGTGNVAGASFQIGRNASGNGAAGTLELMDRSGTSYFLWVEGGKLRIHTARPTEDNTTVSHTAGTVVGTQS